MKYMSYVLRKWKQHPSSPILMPLWPVFHYQAEFVETPQWAWQCSQMQPNSSRSQGQLVT